MVSSSFLASLMKTKVDAIDISNGEITNDAYFTAIAEALVIAFNENNIELSPINNGGMGSFSVYTLATPPTLAWDSAPTGTYNHVSTGDIATTSVNISVTGGWSVGGYGNFVDQNGSGIWKPDTNNDILSYEIKIDHSGDAVFNFGSATSLGTWNDFDENAIIYLSDSIAGPAKSASLTIEIRVKNNVANTTGPATFTISANGDDPL